jgi:replicative DNA helicase
VNDVWARSRLAELGGSALADLATPNEAFIRWPFDTVDYVTGPMAPGDVWFVAGLSGGGKTTFVRRAVELWLATGRRVAVFPLETTPEKYLTEMAAVALGLPPGEVVSGRMDRESEDMKRVRDEVRRVTLDPDVGSRFIVAHLDRMVVDAFEAEVERALGEIGAELVIVDHIDHLASSEHGTGDWSDSVKVAHAGLDIAKRYSVVVVFTTQLNGTIYQSQDRLAKYMPPQEQHIRNGQTKRQVATGMLGLYRPKRSIGPLETQEEFKALMKAARAGEADPELVLDQDAMGVVAMKLRNYGNREGRKMCLRFAGGRIADYALEQDRYRR